MTKAFKCDKCGNYEEGDPMRWRVSKFFSVSPFSGWSDRITERKAELCRDCEEELEDVFSGWFGE